MDSIRQRIQKTLPPLLASITKYRFTLLFVILAAAIGFALVRTRSFLDIPRNEERYVEESLKIKYKSLDEKILTEFSSAGQDKTIEVDPQFDPDRQNPFTE